MNEIKILSDRIIIDGHADTREQCETATMLANLLLAQGSGFNCVEYRSGYAEFKKSDVVKLADSELKFPFIPDITTRRTIYVNGITTGIAVGSESSSGTWTTEQELNTSSYTINGNTVVWSDGTILQYNGVDVLPTDTIVENRQYTTRAAAFDGKINVTKSAGVVLKTQGKYCDKDITVVPVLEEKSVTPTESAQEIVPSEGKCGISKVNVGAVQTETKTITPTTSQQTFTPTSGKYFKQVIYQAIQLETKTVAPSASAQTYNPSSGKYFANFTVSAVPSQSKTVTPTKSAQIVNGDSGKWLSSVTVNPIPDEFIQPSGSQDITANGTYDVTDKASVNVNVPTASAVEEVATASAMDALLVEANVGKYYKFTGTTDSNYTNGDLYLVEGAVSSHTLTFVDGLTVKVDNVEVSTPYTLTKSCVITFSPVTAGVYVNGTDYYNDLSASETLTISLSNVDVDITGGVGVPDIGRHYTVTINYTA